MADLKREMIALMRYYEKQGWDWSSAMEFTLQSHNGTLESLIVRTRIGCGMKWKGSKEEFLRKGKP
jgi:hypothetical protein